MNQDKNYCEFKGTLQEIRKVTVNDGPLTATAVIICFGDSFKIVGMDQVAEDLLKCSEGSSVSVTGKLTKHFEIVVVTFKCESFVGRKPVTIRGIVPSKPKERPLSRKAGLESKRGVPRYKMI